VNNLGELKKRIIDHKTKTHNLNFAKEHLKKIVSLSRTEIEQQELNKKYEIFVKEIIKNLKEKIKDNR
jgi:hypothetical protein